MYIGGILFALSGAVLLGVSSWFIYTDYSIVNGWFSTEGEITKSEETFVTYSGNSKTILSLEYAYSLKGKEYSSSVTDFAG
ncbi:DUF3592 domain-containing protein, partial [Candidatus Micrarchaeota archaeon]|nr:DUF3592 domain-containing protein [Candidatus Micrarchaeota archaeon]